MKDILALFTRLVIALEVMAGAKPTTASAAPADEDEVEKPKASKPKAEKTTKPKGPDFTKLREEVKTKMTELVEAGTDKKAIQGVLKSNGGLKLADVPDENLQAVLDELEKMEDIDLD